MTTYCSMLTEERKSESLLPTYTYILSHLSYHVIEMDMSAKLVFLSSLESPAIYPSPYNYNKQARCLKTSQLISSSSFFPTFLFRLFDITTPPPKHSATKIPLLFTHPSTFVKLKQSSLGSSLSTLPRAKHTQEKERSREEEGKKGF